MAVSENTGYPLIWFKLKDVARNLYECVICLEVVKDAVQLRDCGHLFCRYCIDNVLKLQGQCPTCRNEISEEMIFPDKNANRAIGKLEVNCPSSGCEWDGTLNSLLQEHNASCPFFVLNCSNMGCDMQVIRQELEVHVTKCEHRTDVCEHCSSEHVFKDKDEHLSTCLLLPVECENKCSEKKISRNEMKGHLDTVCSKTVIKCKYSAFGCEYECERQEMEEHLNQAIKEHLELSSLEISGLKEKHENDIKELKAKHQEDIKEFRQQIDQILRSNISGTCTMKISNIKERLSLAKSHRYQNKIDGEPFFTSCFGYKMKLSIHVDEKEHGYTGHMGAYLYLMRSDHDETLHWPFNKKCTISVIDQQNEECFRGDHVVAIPQGEEVFERPQRDERQVFCRLTFISHAKLHTRTYIRNDCVYIHVQMGP